MWARDIFTASEAMGDTEKAGGMVACFENFWEAGEQWVLLCYAE